MAIPDDDGESDTSESQEPYPELPRKASFSQLVSVEAVECWQCHCCEWPPLSSAMLGDLPSSGLNYSTLGRKCPGHLPAHLTPSASLVPNK